MYRPRKHARTLTKPTRRYNKHNAALTTTSGRYHDPGNVERS